MARDRAARPEAEAVRLFVAVNLSEEAAAAVERAVDPWRERLPRGRWVPRENWHVTLKFLGGTYPRLRAWVGEGVGEVAAGATPFELRVAGLGVFPGPSRARVLWAGLDDPEGRLAATGARLDGRLAREFRAEKRAYTPHLTVARFNPPVPMREHADALEATRIEAEPFEVDRLVLYRSHLSPRGARYEPLAEFVLGR